MLLGISPDANRDEQSDTHIAGGDNSVG